jgi:hypothetical protein
MKDDGELKVIGGLQYKRFLVDFYLKKPERCCSWNVLRCETSYLILMK